MDKRKEKSQQLIIQTFLKLIQEKDITKITMTDIAEMSNINRGTIYLNFKDKYDILSHSIDFILGKAIETCINYIDKKEKNKESIREVIKAIDEQYVILRKIIRKSDLNVLRQTLENIFTHSIKQNNNEITIQFISSAIVGVIIWWIEQSRPVSIDELSNELWTLLEPHINIWF